MTPGECSKDKLSRIRLTIRNDHARGALVNFSQTRKIGKIQPGRNPVAVHVKRDNHDIEIPGPFATSEKSAFHPIRTRHETQLSGSHSGAPVIVRVQGNDDRVPL